MSVPLFDHSNFFLANEVVAAPGGSEQDPDPVAAPFPAEPAPRTS